MKIKALAPYFGGKRNLASEIVEIIGDHKVYWEPFCGSMAVLFAKPPVEMETVNDLLSDIINLAKVVQDKELCLQLFEKLNRTLYCEQLFREAKLRWSMKLDENIGVIDFQRAYDYFVTSWMGLNGVSGTDRYNYQFALRWCRGGGQGARRWRNVIESMPAWHKRLQNVVIINRDAFEVIENIKDDGDTAIYCDPPYFDKSDKYVHDFNPEQHEKLAKALSRFQKVKVIVSYYDDPILEKFYPDFNKIELSKNYASLRNATRGPKKKQRCQQTEILLCNQQVQHKGLFNVK